MRLPTENKGTALGSMNKDYPLFKMRKNRKGATSKDAAVSHPASHTHNNHLLEASEFSVAFC